MERLQKIIALSGYCSRRKAEELISKGKVKVNGNIITEMGYKTNFSDYIEVEGHPIETVEDKVYYLLNKPRGIVTTASDEKGRKTVVDLIKTDKRIYPVGRLDYDTTGLIILTNDGELTNYLTHPKNNIEKVYVAKIKGLITKDEVRKLCNGVFINGKKTSKAKAKILKIDKKTNSSIVELIIHEGKNHQVKNMFKAIGYDVLKLKRESIAFLTLDGVPSGEYRELSIKEVKKLYGEKNNQD
ncbi:MAG: rRNA pseudouridine synthase [Bacilli bacterium]|nr:rRNA pseudouridine synthase [Bacilli bacterium]